MRAADKYSPCSRGEYSFTLICGQKEFSCLRSVLIFTFLKERQQDGDLSDHSQNKILPISANVSLKYHPSQILTMLRFHIYLFQYFPDIVVNPSQASIVGQELIADKLRGVKDLYHQVYTWKQQCSTLLIQIFRCKQSHLQSSLAALLYKHMCFMVVTFA